jgi:hypothetical protein
MLSNAIRAAYSKSRVNLNNWILLLAASPRDMNGCHAETVKQTTQAFKVV